MRSAGYDATALRTVTGGAEPETVAVLVDACSHRFGGGVTYLSNLLPLLARQEGIGPVIAVTDPGAVLADALASTPVYVERRSRGPSGLLGRLLWEATALDRRSRGAVVLSPNSILPRRLASAVVAVPHNILPFVATGVRHRLQRTAIVRTLRFATGAIFVSEEMRRQVQRFADLPELQRVIPHGLNVAFRLPSAANGAREGIVLLADHHPHKRVDLLISAWTRLGRDRPHLRVIGMSGAPNAPPESVTFEPRLTPAGIAAALRTAKLAVLPSIAESFALPALEALACEAPLVVSDIPTLREVTGGHAVFVNSDTSEVWADAMRHTLEAPPSTAPGREWARQFTWERSAAATARLLLEAHREGQG